MGWNDQIGRCRHALVNATREVELGAMTGAEKTSQPIRAEVCWSNVFSIYGRTSKMRADTFDYKTTEVIANGTDNETEAAAALDAIGVGKITVSQVPSGLADVSVTVGQDYHG